jgi:DNA polymerase elongation subunit (family B)
MKKPKILLLDIETFSLELRGWGLYDQNFGLNQIQQDWTVCAWSAKWVGKSKIYYQDVSKQKNYRDDKKLLKGIYDLIQEADILVTQNGISFDAKKLNARFIAHGFGPVPKKQHIDTKRLAKKQFGFTSNSLEYLCTILNVKHKKMTHRRYPGFELWKGCMAGNMSAWAEMKAYNIRDVVALEEVYKKLAPWGTGVNLGAHTKSEVPVCAECASTALVKNGYRTNNSGRYQRYSCTDCGAWNFGKENLLAKTKRESIRKGQ